MAKQTQVTIGNTEYTLQHPGARWYVSLQDRIRDPRTGLKMNEKYYDEMLENVVADPVVKIDDFDDNTKDLGELISECESFLNAG
ncbi:hypothetical protein J2S78_002057 [Salibacterium salarium]|uniref:hypothetical protein n=1 Tax=Salibacterium salarium TaxID=284579 RepID=UPI002783B847|nr:hypothetical protein [Salibacterium salarium]MDQ0299637.1 hypothetical protein [Salibacterium salarium]